jgi:hypothetical protein
MMTLHFIGIVLSSLWTAHSLVSFGSAFQTPVISSTFVCSSRDVGNHFYNLKAICFMSSSPNSGHNFGDTRDPNPVFPPSMTASFSSVEQQQQQAQDDGVGDLPGQSNTRFSKFAPDPNLSSDDFRKQLKENMKADLERRRKQDPNRGNQPAKSYLDSL